jgi:hypothetical protein
VRELVDRLGDPEQLRPEGSSFEAISQRTGLSVGTVFRSPQMPVAA